MTNERQSFLCVWVSLLPSFMCAMFAMNGSLINSILHIPYATYKVLYIHHLIEAISFVCDHCTFSLIFLERFARSCGCVCLYVCICGILLVVLLELYCVVSCHVMKFNFDKYSYDSSHWLRMRSVHQVCRRVYSYLQPYEKRRRRRKTNRVKGRLKRESEKHVDSKHEQFSSACTGPQVKCPTIDRSCVYQCIYVNILTYASSAY